MMTLNDLHLVALASAVISRKVFERVVLKYLSVVSVDNV